MKKCKLCKKINIREKNSIAISKWCTSCKKIKEAEKKAKHRLTKAYLEKKYKSLHKKAWNKFSFYIRNKGSENGYNKCYTCDKVLPIKKLQAGHFHHNKLDFDIRNVRSQCERCNCYLHGNLAKYATKLVKELGVEGMEKLEIDSNTVSYSKEDLENIIVTYSKFNY